jgi:hypothetical protein
MHAHTKGKAHEGYHKNGIAAKRNKKAELILIEHKASSLPSTVNL